MADFIPWLKCQNPHHPPSHSKVSMVCIREAQNFLVFGCHWCLEVRRLESIQVKTRMKFREEIRSQLRRQGKLLESAPPVVRRLAMDSTERDLTLHKTKG